MPLTHTAPALSLSAHDEASLRRVARSHTTTHRSVLRARALLLAHDGVANNEIARRVGVNPN
ncbi:MAG: IS630 family transposase, partial [Acidimicrobiales bacterium]